MHRQRGTYSGPSTEAALQKAAVELGVPVTDIDHEVLLGSDAEGHVLIRAAPRTTVSPLVDLVARMTTLMGYDVKIKATPRGEGAPQQGKPSPALHIQLLGPDAAELSSESLSSSIVHLVKRIGEKLEPGRAIDMDIALQETDRDAELTELAKLAAERCRRYGRPIALPPMNPYERRLLHVAVREHSELSTESLGSGADRRVVILPEGEKGEELGRDEEA